MGILTGEQKAAAAAAATLMAMAVMMTAAMSAAAQGTASLGCAAKLVSCRNYLNSTKPPEDCCRPLKEAVENELNCLCAIFNSPEILKAFNIDINQAVKLPINCGFSSSDTTLCNSTAAASPAGSLGPHPPPGTPATAGKDNNSAGGGWTRVQLPSLMGLLLVCLSVFT